MVVPHILRPDQQKPHDLFTTPDDFLSAMTYVFNTEKRQFTITTPGIQCFQSSSCKDLPYRPYRLEYIMHITNMQYLTGYFASCDLDKDNLKNQGIEIQNFDYLFEKRVTVNVPYAENAFEKENITFVVSDIPAK